MSSNIEIIKQKAPYKIKNKFIFFSLIKVFLLKKNTKIKIAKRIRKILIFMLYVINLSSDK